MIHRIINLETGRIQLTDVLEQVTMVADEATYEWCIERLVDGKWEWVAES